MFRHLERSAYPGDAIEKGIRRPCAERGEPQVFTGDPARQITEQCLKPPGAPCTRSSRRRRN